MDTLNTSKPRGRKARSLQEEIAAHRLDGIPVEHWRQAIEEIKASLHRHSSESPHPVQPHA